MRTRLRETWCYLIYPAQDSPQDDVQWIGSRVAAQEGLLARASRKLVTEEAPFVELGPARLARELDRYIWNGRDHVPLRDL